MGGFFGFLLPKKQEEKVHDNSHTLLQTIKDLNDVIKMQEKNLNDLIQNLKSEQDRNNELQSNLVVLLQSQNLIKIKELKRANIPVSRGNILSPNEREKKIIEFVQSKDTATTSEIQTLVSLRRETTARLLSSMVDRGLLKRHGSGKTTKYILNR
jgi:predicted transcriptional regulator